MSFSLIKTSLTAGLLSASVLAFAADDRPVVGPYVQAYSGDENAQVFVVRLGPPEKAEALVLVSGVDCPVDGVVQKARVINDGSQRRSYRVKKGQDEYELLRLEYTSGNLFVAAFPHGLSAYRVSYNESLSQSASAEHLLTQWLQQKPAPR